jgi:gamma-butyrobetaine dioxygenase
MDTVVTKVDLDPQCGGVVLRASDNRQNTLHPLWLRERVTGPEVFDEFNRQRLYEHSEFPPGLTVEQVKIKSDALLELGFSDGFVADVSMFGIMQELGWGPDPQAPPAPIIWDASLNSLPEAEWEDLDIPEHMKALLEGYYQHGFCIINETPTELDSLLLMARRFGYLRETNFGETFSVITEARPSDLAYTSLELSSHADNPYREPVPGIQFLHCLKNEVKGGLSTLVDGLAIAEQLRAESPEQFDVLTKILVRFRYEAENAILQSQGPMIELDAEGQVFRIRLSSRVDYVLPLDPETLSIFYAGRRRLHQLADDPAYKIKFPFKPGLLLMMDNYRLLHGRTAFDESDGDRFLKGCYIDHDGPDSLYRVLVRDNAATHVGRDVK